MSLQVLPPQTRVRGPRGRVDILERVPDAVAEDFLAIYRDAFAPLETRSPARQSLTDDEFRHEMEDPTVLKFAVHDARGEIVGLSLVSSDLASVPWISVPYFANRFPEHLARGALYYFGALLVRPERQGGPWAHFLLEHLFHFLAERQAIACFDCCGFNVDVVRLPDLIDRVGATMVHFETLSLDRQEYFATVVEGLK